jgi:hypothetical protein
MFENSYQNIFTALRNPVMRQSIDTPASKAEWRRFFGMMDTLERNQIAEFKNGRYVLHPSRRADVVAQAEAILAEISKPLTLLEKLAEAIATPEPVSAVVTPEFNTCPVCQGKGRVMIEDTFGYFGSFPCLTCGGKKQIPVPPPSTFPPVDLSIKPESPNALLFSDKPKAALVPQALEVGGVHVLVEAPAPVLSVTAESMVLAEDEDTQPLPKLVPADCDDCGGKGIVIDNSSGTRLDVRTCPGCGGSGEDDTSLKYPSWEIATEAEMLAAGMVLVDGEYKNARLLDTQSLPVIDSPEGENLELIFADVAMGEEPPTFCNCGACAWCCCPPSSEDDCPECLGHGFLNCIRCNGSGYVDTSGNPCSCKPEDYVCFKCGGTGKKQAEDENPGPVVKAVVCSVCGSAEMCRDENEGIEDYQDCDICVHCCWAKNHKCEKCGETMHSDDGDLWCEACHPRNTTEEVEKFLAERGLPDLQTIADAFVSARITPLFPSPTAVEIVEAVQAIAESAIQKHYVRINTTGRGLSSGKYELIRREYKYGRSWMVVKFTTAEELPHWFPAEKCELVVAPNNEPKVIEPVIAPRPSLLRGQQVFQALNGHGFEETKAALNALHAVVVAEILNGNKALLTEGQGT